MIFSLFLCACQQHPVTYDYLMQHPDVLQTEAENCNNASDTQKSCADVKKAARDFMDLVNARAREPEKFGQQILALQNEIGQLQVSGNDQAKYQQDQQQLKVLYAVVAATSSE